jgi:hypothetical protein
MDSQINMPRRRDIRVWFGQTAVTFLFGETGNPVVWAGYTARIRYRARGATPYTTLSPAPVLTAGAPTAVQTTVVAQLAALTASTTPRLYNEYVLEINDGINPDWIALTSGRVWLETALPPVGITNETLAIRVGSTNSTVAVTGHPLGPLASAVTTANAAAEAANLAAAAAYGIASQAAAIIQATQGQGVNPNAVSLQSFCTVDFSGTVDNTAAINAGLAAASAAGVRLVSFPAGGIRIDGTLTIPINVGVIGQGRGVTRLDKQQATAASINAAHIRAEGAALTTLPALASNPVGGSRTLVFASAPSVVTGDVLVIYNPTNSSFSARRTYYRAGEMVRVLGVSGNTVTIDSPLYYGYVAGAVTVYRINGTVARIRDLTLIGANLATEEEYGILMRWGIGAKVENVEILNCSYAGLWMQNCYESRVTDCRFNEAGGLPVWGGDYGLLVGNSQDLFVSGNAAYGTRHGIATGGSGNAGDVPSRNIKYEDNIVGTYGSALALDMHGNSEYCSVRNNTIFGGVLNGGDNNAILNNTIYSNGTEAPIFFGELLGASFNISGNTLYSAITSTTSGAFWDAGGNSNIIDNLLIRGGEMVFSDNVLVYTGTSLSGDVNWGEIINRGYALADPINISIINNQIRTPATVRLRNCQVINQSGGGWGTVRFENNNGQNASGLELFSASAVTAATRVKIVGNELVGGSGFSHYATNVKESLTFKSNLSANQRYTAVLGGTSTSDRLQIFHAEGNTHQDDCTNTSTGGAGDDVPMVVRHVVNATNHSNMAQMDNERFTLTNASAFLVGEVVTDGATSATARIADKQGNVATNFQVGSTITGGTSGATSTVTAAVSFVTGFRYRYTNITALWSGANVQTRGISSDTVTNVTTNTTI